MKHKEDPPPVLVRNKTYWEVKNLSHKNLVLAFFLPFSPFFATPNNTKNSRIFTFIEKPRESEFYT